ncbi:ATP-binding protein [Planobispora siamensis]|uniref:Histidine kinase/HSP90-like ATPase domain-containing protein n=1 Tax=Planobispora siamensis TaxID=936338 RepID=A0A8J3SH63_9ACTN|nr:ATP-binding protein [Planobispora siamensis]GIH93239.1 hypothetical protein Psi01_38690 [Planobispora siamensis]
MRSVQLRQWAITADLSTLRDRITDSAKRAGLRGRRLDDLLLATNEAVINVLEHGGGRGTVSLSHDGTDVHVEITDAMGRLSPLDTRRHLPGADASRGFGLWLIGRLCDEFTISQHPGRSSVRLRMRIVPAPQPTLEPALP